MHHTESCFPAACIPSSAQEQQKKIRKIKKENAVYLNIMSGTEDKKGKKENRQQRRRTNKKENT